MSWSKVKKGKKPIGWWYHKIMCEIGWSIRFKTDYGLDMYYDHLSVMYRKYRRNIYGEKL